MQEVLNKLCLEMASVTSTQVALARTEYMTKSGSWKARRYTVQLCAQKVEETVLVNTEVSLPHSSSSTIFANYLLPILQISQECLSLTRSDHPSTSCASLLGH